MAFEAFGIFQQSDHATTPDGPTRHLRAAGSRTRAGIGLTGMPAASPVRVRSLDGEALRTEDAHTDDVIVPARLPAPMPPREPEPDVEVAGYAYDDLRRAVQAQLDVHRSAVTSGVIAERIGSPIATVQQWLNRGVVPEFAADAAAVALGLHPSMFWSAWWDDGLAQADRYDTDRKAVYRDRARRKAKGWPADEPPPPRGEESPRLARKRAHYATDGTRTKAYHAAYRSRPEVRERKRQQAQAWREANRERHRAYQRAYRARKKAEREQEAG